MSHTPTPIPGEDAQAAPEAQLYDEIEALRGELEQLRADSLRERADLENQRKRLARDVEQARRFANERLLGELLPVFDSLDAGLAAAAGQRAAGVPEGLPAQRPPAAPGAGGGGAPRLNPSFNRAAPPLERRRHDHI